MNAILLTIAMLGQVNSASYSISLDDSLAEHYCSKADWEDHRVKVNGKQPADYDVMLCDGDAVEVLMKYPITRPDGSNKPIISRWTIKPPLGAGPVIDGLVNRIETRVQQVEQNTGRIADWLERSETEEGPISKFLDRLGRWGAFILGTAVLLVLPFGLGYLIRSMRGSA